LNSGTLNSGTLNTRLFEQRHFEHRTLNRSKIQATAIGTGETLGPPTAKVHIDTCCLRAAAGVAG
jgi:hypothetical protein